MAYQYVTVEQVDGVGVLTLNRPEKLNALDEALVGEIFDAFLELEKDPEVRVIVIAGGPKAFAAGADVTEVQAVPSAHLAYEFASKRAALYDGIYNCAKPVIASISGFALGGGCELVLSADLRIASETAKLGLPEINLGILPGCGIQRLVKIVGPGIAKDILLTGRHVGAEEALRFGLVNRVVPKDALKDETMKLAKQLAAQPPWSVKFIKLAVAYGQSADLPLAMELERLGFGMLFSTEDMREGVSAFLNKKAASFKGK